MADYIITSRIEVKDAATGELKKVEGGVVKVKIQIDRLARSTRKMEKGFLSSLGNVRRDLRNLARDYIFTTALIAAPAAAARSL